MSIHYFAEEEEEKTLNIRINLPKGTENQSYLQKAENKCAHSVCRRGALSAYACAHNPVRSFEQRRRRISILQHVPVCFPPLPEIKQIHKGSFFLFMWTRCLECCLLALSRV